MKASYKMYTKSALLFMLMICVGIAVAVLSTDAESAQAKKKSNAGQKIDPTDPTSVIYLDTEGNLAGIGDPNKPASMAFQAGRAWHPQALSAAGLPKDRYGLIDWAKLVRENLIKPKPSLDPNADEMPPLKMDVLVEAKGDFVDDVIYPHEMHTYWLNCEACHPGIFIPAKGQNHMTMTGIAEGKWCGRCHGKVAFPLTDCTRCHTSPKNAKK